MRNSLLSLVLGLAVLVVAGCGRAAPGAIAAGTQGVAASSAPGEIVVRFKRQARLQTLGLRSVGHLPGIDAVVVQAPNVAATLAALRADAEVVYAEPNRRRNWLAPEAAEPALRFDTGDDLLELLWGMKRIGAPAAWQVGPGSRKVVVAVVDSGIDYTHPDFGDRVIKGRDFVNHDDDPMDDKGHGTHCAGIIAAGLGNGGVVGVCPAARLLAVKVLNQDGWGADAGVAEGIVYAADQGADVINLSLGSAEQIQVINDAVAYATRKGALVVAAMGNEHSGEPSFPGASPGAMAVGAIQPGDLMADYSNWGEHISVSAPGTWVMSTLPNGRWGRRSGTSMATPHVAGLAALLESVNPKLDAAALRKRIETTVDDLGYPGWDKFYGHGCINAAKALAATRVPN